MKGYVKSYNKLEWIIKLIVAIIPITGWINAILYRLGKGNLLGAILAIPFGFVFWVVDLVTVILSGKITVLA